jgi:hypothetical protein
MLQEEKLVVPCCNHPKHPLLLISQENLRLGVLGAWICTVHPSLPKEKLFPVQNWVPAYWPVPGSLVAVAVKVAGAQIATTPVLHIITPLASYPMT